MNKKQIISLGLAGYLTLTAVPITFAAKDMLKTKIMPISITVDAQLRHKIKMSTKEIESKSEELKLNMKIPIIEGLEDIKYQGQLNDIIMRHAMKAKEEIEKEAKVFAQECKKNGWNVMPYSLTVDYDVYSNDEIFSLRVVTYASTGGTGNPVVAYYNVLNKEQAQRIELKDLFKENIDYKEIINQEIKRQIKDQIETEDKSYFDGDMGFQSISDTQGFYIDNGDLVIAFSKYEIAPGYMGTPEFHIPFKELKDVLNEEYASKVLLQKETLDKALTVKLEEGQYYTKEDGVIMVPIRETTEGLQYAVEWNEETQSIDIHKGAQWTSIKIGEDRYFFGKMAPMPLGTAPELNEGITYVPESFIKEILKTEVIHKETGDIIIVQEDIEQMEDTNELNS